MGLNDIDPRFVGTISRISIGFTSRRPFPFVGQDPAEGLAKFESFASIRSRPSGDRHRADRLGCFALIWGNHYCHRDDGSGSNSYHYSNQYVYLSFLGSDTPAEYIGAGMAVTIIKIRMEANTIMTAREVRRTRPLPLLTAGRNETTRMNERA